MFSIQSYLIKLESGVYMSSKRVVAKYLGGIWPQEMIDKGYMGLFEYSAVISTFLSAS